MCTTKTPNKMFKTCPNEMLNKYINSYIVAQSQKKMETFHEQTENFNVWIKNEGRKKS
jgi:hypothetical protein